MIGKWTLRDVGHDPDEPFPSGPRYVVTPATFNGWHVYDRRQQQNLAWYATRVAATREAKRLNGDERQQ